MKLNFNIFKKTDTQTDENKNLSPDLATLVSFIKNKGVNFITTDSIHGGSGKTMLMLLLTFFISGFVSSNVLLIESDINEKAKNHLVSFMSSIPASTVLQTNSFIESLVSGKIKEVPFIKPEFFDNEDFRHLIYKGVYSEQHQYFKPVKRKEKDGVIVDKEPIKGFYFLPARTDNLSKEIIQKYESSPIIDKNKMIFKFLYNLKDVITKYNISYIIFDLPQHTAEAETIFQPIINISKVIFVVEYDKRVDITISYLKNSIKQYLVKQTDTTWIINKVPSPNETKIISSIIATLFPESKDIKPPVFTLYLDPLLNNYREINRPLWNIPFFVKKNDKYVPTLLTDLLRIYVQRGIIPKISVEKKFEKHNLKI